MRPCRKKPCRTAETSTIQNKGTAALPESHVHRYCHPIQIKGTARPGSTEEMLASVLAALSQQAGALEELLRRTEREDTR